MIPMLRTISAISCFLMSGPLAAASTDCMSTRQTRDYLRGNTLIGKSLSSGMTWKAKFRKAGPAIFNYSSGGKQTYRWFVNDGVVLLTGANGKKYKKRICRRNGKYYWTDAATGKVKSRILRSTLGDRTAWVKSTSDVRPATTTIRRRTSSIRPTSSNRIKCKSIEACSALIKSRNYNGDQLGSIYFQRGAAYFYKGIRTRKKNPGEFSPMGRFRSHYMARAIRDLNKSKELDYSTGTTVISMRRHSMRGHAYYETRQLTKCVSELNKVIPHTKLGSRALYLQHSMRGECLSGLGQHRAALKDFQKSKTTNFATGYDYYNAGLSHLKLKQYNRAISNFKEASSREISLKKHARKRIAEAKRAIKRERGEKQKLWAQRRQQHQEAQQCIKKYHSSKVLYQQFKKRASVVEWPDNSALSTNPYVWKGKVVGILTVFHKMLSEHEASFGKNPFGLGTEAYVSGVPSTKFQKPEVFLLAGKVTGKNGSTVALKYVDAISCGNSMECENVLFWQKMDELRKRLGKQPKQKRGLSFNRLVLGISAQDERCAMSIGR